MFFIFPLSIFSLFSIINIVKPDTECPYVKITGDRRINKSSMRIVQYNVEWLYIDHYSSFDCPGTQCTWKNLSEAETHLTYVSQVVKELNPDIINFCEVEGCDELNMLSNTLDGTYQSYLKKGTDTSTGQNVGMLTRIDPLKDLYRTENRYNYPILGSECGFTGDPGSAGVSKHYIIEFIINNTNIAFISAHLLAIPEDPSRCAQREAQAVVLQEVINDFISKKYEVVVIGDFNDYDAEIPDVNDNKPISKVLDILKGNYGPNAGNYLLHSVSENIEKDERYSDWWDSDNNCDTDSVHDYSLIDHILVTEFIKKYIKNAFIYHGYPEFCGKYNSDHYPVVIDLEI
jgi:exonuclease III